jgi:hypothetical protein
MYVASRWLRALLALAEFDRSLDETTLNGGVDRLDSTRLNSVHFPRARGNARADFSIAHLTKEPRFSGTTNTPWVFVDVPLSPQSPRP